MSENRLKVMRKVTKKTQKDIAELVSITQNAYSYWETGKVNIDAASLTKLAVYYGVSLDFLSGRSFSLSEPIESWSKDQQEEYYTSNEHKRTYLEYLWGAPVFSDEQGKSAEDAKILQSPAKRSALTEHEERVLKAYRSQPNMQLAVDKLLGIDDTGSYTVYEAARSSDNHPPRIVRKASEEWDAIVNAPETDETLI